MKKRSLIRERTQISVACSSLTASNPIFHSDGVMLNCSYKGTCIEINQLIHKGSILIIKATGWIGEKNPAETPNGFSTLAPAEVKWSKPSNAENASNYKMGLKYLPNL